MKTARRLLGAVLFAALTAAAELTPLKDGQTLTSSDVSLYDVSANATVLLTGTATDGEFVLTCSFRIPAGMTVTVDSSAVADLTTVRMKGSLRGGGTLAFGAGVEKALFGATYSRSNILHLPAFEGDISFAEADGEVVFTDGVSLINWPTRHSVAEGALLALFGKDLFTEDFTLADYDIELTEEGSMSAGVTVTVPAGRTIYHRSSSLEAITAESTTLASWKGQLDYRNSLNVVLDGGRVVFQDRSARNFVVGDVTGTGDIDFNGTGSGGFIGRVNYTGEARQTYSTAAPPLGVLEFRLADGSSFENVDCRITHQYGGALRFSGCERLPVKSLSCTGASLTNSNRVEVANGCSVTFGSVSGKVVFDGVSGQAGGEVTLLSAARGTSVRATDAITVALAGDQTFHDELDVVRLAIRKDANVQAAFSDRLRTIDNRGGSLAELPGWQVKASLWTDASDVSTFVSAREQIAKIGGTVTVADNQIFEWRDVRPWNADYSFRVSRYDTSAKNLVATLFPFRDETTTVAVRFPQNDKTRMAICPPTLGAATATLSAKCVIAVYSAALGGGKAMFTERSGRLARIDPVTGSFPTAAAPICLDPSVSVATNGIPVNGVETGFSGGWQIVTLTTETPLQLRGIAHPSEPDGGSGNGGQTYAEILVFPELPTADEIAAIEGYLAKKWNLPYARVAQTRELAMKGTGSVALAGDLELASGSDYSGALDLNGSRLTLPADKVPWTDAQVPADGRIIWVDARYPNAVSFGDDPAKPDEVERVYTRDNVGLLTGKGDYYMTSPYDAANSAITACDRRVRFANGWFLFANAYDEKYGNYLSMRKLPYSPMASYTDSAESVSVKGGFFALDTSLGGGSPVVSAANGAVGDLLSRGTAKIWNTSLSIANWLDGEEVDGTARGFSGRPEILSFNVANGASASGKCFGYPNPSTKSATNREIMGEWILYSRNLADDERAGIESYLMKKWLGKMRPGFTETRGISLSGSETVSVQSVAQLPALEASFSGAVEVRSSDLSFTIARDATSASDAISLPGRKLSFAGTVTVSLSFSGKAYGEIALIEADLDPGADFELGSVMGISPAACTLRKTASGLVVSVARRGLLLYLH